MADKQQPVRMMKADLATARSDLAALQGPEALIVRARLFGCQDDWRTHAATDPAIRAMTTFYREEIHEPT